MVYNIDFLIASLVFLAFVFVHFLRSKSRESDLNMRIFEAFAVVGFCDIAMDVVTSCLITGAGDWPLWFLYGSNQVFYILQSVVPVLLFFYALTLARNTELTFGPATVVGAVPLVAFFLLIATDPLHQLMFYFDPATHEYLHGPLYFGMYAYSFFYGFVTLCYLALHWKSYERSGRIAILEFVSIMVVCVGIQALFTNVLLTGFAVGLALTILFFTMNNPFELLDPLTKVQESEGFKRVIADLSKRGKTFNIVFISLDKLGELNDALGDGAADELVKMCANHFVHVARSTYVFRITGSRFAIIVNDRRDLRRVMADLQKFFAHERTFAGGSYTVSASIGCVKEAHRVDSPEELVRYIDYLLSTLRRTDGVIDDEEVDWLARFRRREQLRGYLRRSVDEDLLDLYMQPVLDVSDGRFHSVEVLSRMTHPTLGQVFPDEFIKLAEEENLVFDLDRRQFINVCRFVREHRESFGVDGITQVKFNISPLELVSNSVASDILETIRHYELSPSLFCFEITETAATRYSELLTKFSESLIAAGCHVALDDFGSGFANLDMIARFPFDHIKMDRMLLTDIMSDQKVSKLYHGVMRMIREMEISVVCEGVETEQEAELLSSWGAHELQGYLFSKPVPAEEALAFVRRENAR